MPRPGPRPYECVRRAWHSDRHQPIRGSLIQEIFRVVNGIHSSATKKNKEWQEKLPSVVLKAEEIMYSKANSEAEYMDVKTLWDRTNDAINTIIRREESTETGELLQPCIEAALILGCTARRASRSQRNNNPRCYLSSGAQEAAPAPARAPDNVTHVGSASLPPSHPGNSTSAPRFMPNYSATARPTTMNPTQLRLDSSTHVTNNGNPTTSHGFLFAVDNFPNQVIALDGQRSVKGGRSYPLYYGTITHHQNTDSQLIFRPPQGSTSATTVPAMPQVQSVVEPIEKGFLENLFISDGAINASNRNPRGDLMGGTEYLPKVDCDLSLRLGREVEDIESSSSQEGSEFCIRPPRTTKEFCFFPRDSGNQPVESSNLISRDEGLNLEGPSRKRKAPVDNLVEGEHFSHRPNFSHNLYFGRMNYPDK